MGLSSMMYLPIWALLRGDKIFMVGIVIAYHLILILIHALVRALIYGKGKAGIFGMEDVEICKWIGVALESCFDFGGTRTVSLCLE